MSYIGEIGYQNLVSLHKDETGEIKMAKKTNRLSMRIDDELLDFLEDMAKTKNVKFKASTEAYNLILFAKETILKKRAESPKLEAKYSLTISVDKGDIDMILNKESKNDN